VLRDRLAIARAFARCPGLVLKCCRAWWQPRRRVFVNRKPGMATAGTGDILSGRSPRWWRPRAPLTGSGGGLSARPGGDLAPAHRGEMGRASPPACSNTGGVSTAAGGDEPARRDRLASVGSGARGEAETEAAGRLLAAFLPPGRCCGCTATSAPARPRSRGRGRARRRRRGESSPPSPSSTHARSPGARPPHVDLYRRRGSGLREIGLDEIREEAPAYRVGRAARGTRFAPQMAI
jgi:hypothetical protein